MSRAGNEWFWWVNDIEVSIITGVIDGREVSGDHIARVFAQVDGERAFQIHFLDHTADTILTGGRVHFQVFQMTSDEATDYSWNVDRRIISYWVLSLSLLCFLYYSGLMAFLKIGLVVCNSSMLYSLVIAFAILLFLLVIDHCRNIMVTHATLVKFLNSEHFFNTDESWGAWAAHNSQIGCDADLTVLALVFQDFQESFLDLHIAGVVSKCFDGGKTDGNGQSSRSDAFRNAFLYFGRKETEVAQSFKTAQNLETSIWFSLSVN